MSNVCVASVRPLSVASEIQSQIYLFVSHKLTETITFTFNVVALIILN